MVYGEAEWIDANRAHIERYPTRSHKGNVAPFEDFWDGCFICQPTVFLRREAFEEIGGLNSDLHTAMDFDMWLRLYRAFPGRIGYHPSLQAYSRLYPENKTFASRDAVFRESMDLITREFGCVPPHWVETWVSEIVGTPRFRHDPEGFRRHRDAFVQWALPLIRYDLRTELLQRVHNNSRVALMSRQVFVDLHADGWTSETCRIYLQGINRGDHLLIIGRNAAPAAIPMRLELRAQDSLSYHLKTVNTGPFELGATFERLQYPRPVVELRCSPCFVPSRHMPAAQDDRTLGVMLTAVKISGSETNRAPTESLYARHQ